MKTHIALILVLLSSLLIAISCTTCPEGYVFTCRESNCVYECNCIKEHQVQRWLRQAEPCDTAGTGHGNGHGNGNMSIGIDPSPFPSDGPLTEPYGFFVSPNPMTSSATISFYLDRFQQVSLQLFDLSGKHVSDIQSGPFETGQHHLDCNFNVDEPGMYLLRYIAGDTMLVKKISIQK